MAFLHRYTFYVLIASYSISNVHESVTAAQSLEPYLTSNISTASSSSDVYINIVNETTESFVETPDFYSTETIALDLLPTRITPEILTFESSSPDTSVMYSTSEVSEVVMEELQTFGISNSDYISTPSTSINDYSIESTKDVQQNVNEATEIGNELFQTPRTPPWDRTNRITREEEIRKSLKNRIFKHNIQSESDIGQSKKIESFDGNLLSDVVTPVDYEIRRIVGSQRAELSTSAPNNAVESKVSFPAMESTNQIATLDTGKMVEKSTNDLEDSEDRYGAVFPYLDHRQFLRERYWPIYRRHPYNNYLRYPIFPGR